jgi:hypothetical protein
VEPAFRAVSTAEHWLFADEGHHHNGHRRTNETAGIRKGHDPMNSYDPSRDLVQTRMMVSEVPTWRFNEFAGAGTSSSISRRG